jgi:pimeloyl-ACP methyl ester carboxylesterase
MLWLAVMSCRWAPQVQALNAAGYRTITPDLPGLGQSDKPTDLTHYNMQTSILPAMIALLDALDVQQVSVVGHDLGTGLAWGLAFACPERVNKVVTLSVGFPGRPGTTKKPNQPHVGDLLLTVIRFRASQAMSVPTLSDALKPLCNCATITHTAFRSCTPQGSTACH